MLAVAQDTREISSSQLEHVHVASPCDPGFLPVWPPQATSGWLNFFHGDRGLRRHVSKLGLTCHTVTLLPPATYKQVASPSTLDSQGGALDSISRGEGERVRWRHASRMGKPEAAPQEEQRPFLRTPVRPVLSRNERAHGWFRQGSIAGLADSANNSAECPV